MIATLARIRDRAPRFALAAMVTLALAGAAHAQDAKGNAAADGYRITRPGLPDIVLPSMNAARGRVYFASRACVVCHRVNRVGGRLAPGFDEESRDKEVDVLDFVTRMWRGANSMVALQSALFGEPLDLSPEELGDIIAFLHDPAERAKFSENDIPQFIRDFMSARQGAPRR